MIDRLIISEIISQSFNTIIQQFIKQPCLEQTIIRHHFYIKLILITIFILKNKSYQMNQKIIFSAQKTSKKVTLFSDQKAKKFNRKRSDGQRSIDSKRSRESSIGQIYIKHVGLASSRLSQIHNQVKTQIQQINLPLEKGLLTPDQSKKALYSRTNSNREKTQEGSAMKVRIQMIQTQIRVKESECERLKLSLNQERQRRRKTQNQKRLIIKQIQQLQKDNEKLAIQNKKLLKEKEYLIKQVQFLEKINYDQNTRSAQSYREKHMIQEIDKLRTQLKTKRSLKELELEKNCEELRHQKDSANEKFKSMVCCVQVLRSKVFRLEQELLEDKQLSRQKIMISQDYLQLKQRYRRFIQVYKEVRAQNYKMKKMIQNIQEDLVLSDQEQTTKSDSNL